MLLLRVIFVKTFAMYRRFFLALNCLMLVTLFCLPQNAVSQTTKPKLVVGLVIDQMRWDYLYRYSELYGPGGFKRLLKDGFSAENTMIPYVPTYTAPGHTCIYTGSIPAIHGIVGNNWFDKNTGRNVYCTDDSTVNTVGTSSKAGKMSPDNLWVTTITDELRLSNNFKSKVIGIALKDRGAILPAGHSANAAYWYDGGKWITSTYYMNELPGWVKAFNDKDEPGDYMSREWNTLLPITKYDLSTADDKPYENIINGDAGVVFPHNLSAISSTVKYESFRTTPFANTFTFDFAKKAIENENMGTGAVTDFLTVSISSTDYIGHTFGPNSIEIEDTYLRLDKDIEDFLIYLDTKVGKGNYTLFLSADHGVAHIPGFLQENRIPGGTFDDGEILRDINTEIEARYGIKKVVRNLQNYQLYLNDTAIEASGINREQVIKLVMTTLKQKPYIIEAFELKNLTATTLPEPQKTMMANGYNPKRSGDIQFTFKPGYFDGGKKGTTHGLWNPYDAHIPLLFYGWGVIPGKTNRETYMTDISATVAAILKIQMPSGCVGKPISEVIK
jgi:predicted AlkP superfamily pyrophosphatase or phosphodiesterase